jgi:uncharacterized protein (TIGR03435 family)
MIGAGGGALFMRDRAHIHYSEMSMEVLAAHLSMQLGGPVADFTGLPGKYDIDLCWSQDPSRASVSASPDREPVATASTPSVPRLMQALQDQLGLRLELKKGPVDFVVVDHAEKLPTHN